MRSGGEVLKGQAAQIKYLQLLTDDELVVLIDFHGRHFQRWEKTGEDARVSLVYHGQILWALLDECDRRGKTPTQLGEEFNRKVDIERCWRQTPANA
jgi:hypothetical protein